MEDRTSDQVKHFGRARINSQYNFTEFKLEKLRLISKLGVLGNLKNPTNTIFIMSLWWVILHINLSGLRDALIAVQTLLGYACFQRN